MYSWIQFVRNTRLRETQLHLTCLSFGLLLSIQQLIQNLLGHPVSVSFDPYNLYLTVHLQLSKKSLRVDCCFLLQEVFLRAEAAQNDVTATIITRFLGVTMVSDICICIPTHVYLFYKVMNVFLLISFAAIWDSIGCGCTYHYNKTMVGSWYRDSIVLFFCHLPQNCNLLLGSFLSCPMSILSNFVQIVEIVQFCLF